MNTRISATDDTIVFSEVGTFEFNIKGSSCKASVSRSRSFRLQKRAGEEEAPPAASASATATASTPRPKAFDDPVPPYEPPVLGKCDPSAAPARFEVRPAKKLVRPGESFTLDVRVLDKGACRLDVKPEVSIDDDSSLKSSITIDKLSITVSQDAPEGVAELEIAVGSAKVKVSVEVTPAEKYEALLKERGLNARGEDDAALVVEIEPGLGSATTTAEDTARARRVTFLVIVGGVAAVLGLVALALVRRGRRAPVDRSTDLPPPPNVTFFEGEATSMECPRCGRVLAAGVGFCPTDGTSLVPSKQPPPPPVAPSEPPPPGVERPKKRREPDKICPNCGERFRADAGFCGKDGTQLVPIN